MSNTVYIVILVAVFVVMSLAGFIVMGIDKQKAKKKKWRIPEATLFAFAICFGGVGSTLGMFVFRHKTQHWYFKVFFPIFALIDLAALAAGCYFLAVM
ncbi:MAG: DUF1294 domain-containing protein [Clostridia bacterium]|nr:DUF1294 domain-containing protein [Clostridia bacterium]